MALVISLILSGCSAAPPAQDANADAGQQDATTQNSLQPEPAANIQSAANTVLPAKPKASESATKIYIGMRQAGLKEAVVDVQPKEVVIGFFEDSALSNEALAYRAFGLSASFEPRKEKTTVLIFNSGKKRIEASALQKDILALVQGNLTNAEFKQKVRWVQ